MSQQKYQKNTSTLSNHLFQILKRLYGYPFSYIKTLVCLFDLLPCISTLLLSKNISALSFLNTILYFSCLKFSIFRHASKSLSPQFEDNTAFKYKSFVYVLI